MGSLTGTEDVHLPKYVRELGSAMAECSYTHKVHLARRNNDTDTRRILSFWPSEKGRFIAELAWDKKKYSFDITPRDDSTFLQCGSAVVRAIKDHAPELPLEGEELFAPPPVDIFMRDKRVDISPHQSAVALSDEPLPDDSYTPHTDAPVPHTEEAAEPFTAPKGIWNARTLALYHAALELILSHNDPAEYVLENDHGKIRALTEKMTSYFSAATGSIHRALDPLRQYKVIEKEIAANNTPTGWWIVRLVADAPPADKDLKTLWNSRNNQQGRPFGFVPPVSLNGPASAPESLNANVQQNQPHESDMHASMPDDFAIKVETLRALQISLRADVQKAMNNIYATIADFCRKQNEELVWQQERFTDFLTTQDALQVQNVSTLLKRLAEVISQKQ